MVLVRLRVVAELNKGTSDMPDMCSPDQETVKGSHWDGVLKETLKAAAEERRNERYAQERRKCMVEKAPIFFGEASRKNGAIEYLYYAELSENV